jgi:hypothetical protein
MINKKQFYDNLFYVLIPLLLCVAIYIAYITDEAKKEKIKNQEPMRCAVNGVYVKLENYEQQGSYLSIIGEENPILYPINDCH